MSELYHVAFDENVQAQLRSGAATLARDRSGVTVALARGEAGQFLGVGRLIPAAERSGVPSGIGNLVGSLLGIGNLIVGGINAWQISKLRKTVAAEAQATRDLVLADGEETRAQLAREGEAIRAGLAQLSGELASATSRLVGMLASVEDIARDGFSEVLDRLDLLAAEQQAGFASVKRDLAAGFEGIRDRELRGCVLKIDTIARALAHADVREIESDALRLEKELIPSIRAHLADATGATRISLVLLLAHTSLLLGALRCAIGQADRASATLAELGTFGRNELRSLMDADVSGFGFFRVHMPAALAVVGVIHAARNAELAIAPERLAIADGAIDEGLAFDARLAVQAPAMLAWPAALASSGDDGNRWLRTSFPAEVASRIAGVALPSTGRWQIDFRALAVAAGVPVDAISESGLTDAQANILGPLLEAMADPAERALLRAQILAAAGVELIDEARRAATRELVARGLSAMTHGSYSSADLHGVPHWTLASLAARLQASTEQGSTPAGFRAERTPEEKRLEEALKEVERVLAKERSEANALRAQLKRTQEERDALTTRLAKATALEPVKTQRPSWSETEVDVTAAMSIQSLHGRGWQVWYAHNRGQVFQSLTGRNAPAPDPSAPIAIDRLPDGRCLVHFANGSSRLWESRAALRESGLDLGAFSLWKIDDP